uniref:Polyprotein n=1 Tax=Grapevine leafroll-associated virus 2 TaxID=64003 RepID=A0A4D6EAL8_9CLOS|nr:polyprotein [Grapevine leafroll-associated virus 2]
MSSLAISALPCSVAQLSVGQPVATVARSFLMTSLPSLQTYPSSSELTSFLFCFGAFQKIKMFLSFLRSVHVFAPFSEISTIGSCYEFIRLGGGAYPLFFCSFQCGPLSVSLGFVNGVFAVLNMSFPFLSNASLLTGVGKNVVQEKIKISKFEKKQKKRVFSIARATARHVPSRRNPKEKRVVHVQHLPSGSLRFSQNKNKTELLILKEEVGIVARVKCSASVVRRRVCGGVVKCKPLIAVSPSGVKFRCFAPSCSTSACLKLKIMRRVAVGDCRGEKIIAARRAALQKQAFNSRTPKKVRENPISVSGANLGRSAAAQVIYFGSFTQPFALYPRQESAIVKTQPPPVSVVKVECVAAEVAPDRGVVDKKPTSVGVPPQRGVLSFPTVVRNRGDVIIAGVVHEALKKIKDGLLRFRVGGDMRFSRFFSSNYGCRFVASVRTNTTVWLNCTKASGEKFSLAAACTADYVAMLRYVCGGKFPLVLMSRVIYPDGRCYLAHMRYLCAFYCRPFRESDYALGMWPTVARLRACVEKNFGVEACGIALRGYYTSRNVYHCDYDSAYVKYFRNLSGRIGGGSFDPTSLTSVITVKISGLPGGLPKNIAFGAFLCDIRYVEPVDSGGIQSSVKTKREDAHRTVEERAAGGSVEQPRQKRIDEKGCGRVPSGGFSHLLVGSLNEVRRKVAAGLLRFRVGGDMDFHRSFSTQAGHRLLVWRRSSRSVYLELYSPSKNFLRYDVLPCSGDYAAMFSFAAGGRFPLVLMTRIRYPNGFCYLAHCRYACAFLLRGFDPKRFDIGAFPTAAKLRNRMVSELGERSLGLNLYGAYTSRGVFHCDYDAKFIKDLRLMSAVIAGKDGVEEVVPSDITPAMKQKTIEAVYDRLYGGTDSLLKLSIEKDLIDFKNDVQSLKKDRPIVKVPFYMSEATQNSLTRFYPQFELKFSHSSHSDHPAAAASRLLENETLVRLCGNSVSDIGGCPLFHLHSKTQRRVHVCRPVLDGKDAQRRVVRDLQYSNVRLGDDDKILEGPRNIDICHYPLGACDHESSAMMMVQVYDASLYEICGAMIKKKSRITYLTMVTPGEFLDGRECVYMESLDCEIEVDVHADVVMYKFGSSCYSHKLSIIKDIMTTPYLTLGGFLFSVEMYEVRMGVNYFKITKSEVSPSISCTKLLRYRRANSDVVKVKLPRFDKKRRMCLPGYDTIYLDSKFVSRVFDYVVCNCSAVNSKTFEWVWSFIKSSKSRVIISGKIIHKDVNLDLKYVESFAAVMLASGVRSRLASEYLAKNLSHFSGDCSFIEATSFVLREKIRNMTLNFNERLLQLVKRVAFATLDVSFLDLDSTLESITDFAECKVAIELDELGCLRAEAENEKIRNLAGDSIAAKLASEIVVDIDSKPSPKQVGKSSSENADKREVQRPGLRGGSRNGVVGEFLHFVVDSALRLFKYATDQQRIKSYVRFLDSAVSFLDYNYDNLSFILRVLSEGYSCMFAFLANRGDLSSRVRSAVRAVKEVATSCANASVSKAKVMITFAAAVCAMMFNSCGFSGDGREYKSYIHRYTQVLFDTIFFEDSSYLPIEVLSSAICGAIVTLFSSGSSISLNAFLLQISKGFSLEVVVRNVVRVTHGLSTTATDGVIRGVFSQIVSHLLVGNTGNVAYQSAFIAGVVPLLVKKCVSLIFILREDTYSGFIKHGISEFSFLSSILKFLKGKLVDELKSIIQGVFDSNKHVFKEATQEAIRTTVMQVPVAVVDALKSAAGKIYNNFTSRRTFGKDEGSSSDGACEEYFSCDEGEGPGLKGGSSYGFSILAFFSRIMWGARRLIVKVKHECFGKLFEFLSLKLHEFRTRVFGKNGTDVGVYDFLPTDIVETLSSIEECDQIEELLGDDLKGDKDASLTDMNYFEFSEDFLASVEEPPFAGLRGGSKNVAILAILEYAHNLFRIVASKCSKRPLFLAFAELSSALIEKIKEVFPRKSQLVAIVREYTQRFLRSRMRALGLNNEFVVKSFADLLPALMKRKVSGSFLASVYRPLRGFSYMCVSAERREKFFALVCLIGLSLPFFVRIVGAKACEELVSSARRFYERIKIFLRQKYVSFSNFFCHLFSSDVDDSSASAGLKGGASRMTLFHLLVRLASALLSLGWEGLKLLLSHHNLLFLCFALVDDVNVLIKVLGGLSFFVQPIFSLFAAMLLQPDRFVGYSEKLVTAFEFFLKCSPRAPALLKGFFECVANSTVSKTVRRLLRYFVRMLKLRKGRGLRADGRGLHRQKAVPVIPSNRVVTDGVERLSVKMQGVEALRTELRILEDLDSAVIEKLNRRRNRDTNDDEFTRPAHEQMQEVTTFCSKANSAGLALERAVLVEDAIKSEKLSKTVNEMVRKGSTTSEEVAVALSDDEAVEEISVADERDDSPKTVRISEYLNRLNTSFEFPKPIVVDDNKDTGGLTNAVREFYYMQELALFEIHSKLCAYYDQLRIVNFDRSVAPCSEDAQLYVRKSGSTIVQGKEVRLHIKDFHDHDFLFDGKISINKRRRGGNVLYHDNLAFLASNLFLAGYPFSRSFVFTNSSVDILLYEAPPGGGKTTTLIDSFLKVFKKGEVSTMILTANKSSQVEILKKVEKEVSNIECQKRKDKRSPKKSIYTIDAYLMHHRGCDADVLFIDECFMVHAGSVLACIEFTRCHKVMIFGDSRQIHYIERNELDKCLYGDLDRFVDLQCRVYGNISYRCPWDVCAWLSTVYGNLIATVKGESEGKSSMRINEINSVDDLVPDVGSTFLCMLQSEKLEISKHFIRKGLTKLNVLTVHEAQGETYARVNLVRLKFQEDEPFKSIRHITVALSRHTDSLTYNVLAARRGDATCDAIQKAAELVNKFRVFPTSFGGSVINLNVKKDVEDNSRCKASSAPLSVINDFLNEVNPGTAVIDFGDLSADFSTGPFECGASGVVVRDNISSSNITDHDKQRV